MAWRRGVGAICQSIGVSVASRSLSLLDRVCASMDAGEDRPGQREMVEAIAEAIEARRHLIVQAGTGTGKSLAYLVAALTANRTTVVATATKALQDQLAGKDLPLLAEHMTRPIEWAVLKGRSNYLCRQRLDEASAPQSQLGLEGVAEAAGGGGGRIPDATLKKLQKWATTSPTGDRAELPEEPQPWVWSAVSVGPRECPGAAKCPRGEDCFAEMARRKAAAADVIIVNTHLYGLHLASGAAILPDHDVVVFDEAHEVEDIISATTGLEIGAGQFTNISRIIGGLIADDALTDGLSEDGTRLTRVLAPLVGTRLRRGLPAEVAEVVNAARSRIMDASNAVRTIEDRGSVDVATRKARVATAVAGLVEDLDHLITMPAASVMWVSGSEEHPRLEMAPLDVGLTLDELLWNPEPSGLEIEIAAGPADSAEATDAGFGLPDSVIFTSATIPDTLTERLRIPAGTVSVIDVGTPFDFGTHALLYCATHMPDPRTAAFGPAVATELARLIEAAGGRTLALFTSHRAMNEAADAVADLIELPILRQGDLPKPALIEAFTESEETSLFATMGFWAGIDVPGRSLSLVTIDKIPFPRPDEPLMQARREAAGASGFTTIDLPRAATLLAQGSGRLIRTANDRGVVAVLDPRLATKASYRWQLIAALPPMKRTKEFSEVAEFLESIRQPPEPLKRSS